MLRYVDPSGVCVLFGSSLLAPRIRPVSIILMPVLLLMRNIPMN